MQPQTGAPGRSSVIVVNSMGGRSDRWCAGFCEGWRLAEPRQIDTVDRSAIGSGLRGRNRRSRRIVLKGQDNCQNHISFLFPVGRSVAIVVVVSRMLVVTDVEVKVEEVGARLTVPMPVAGSLQPETTDEDGRDRADDRARLPGISDQGSAEVLHFLIITERNRWTWTCKYDRSEHHSRYRLLRDRSVTVAPEMQQ